MDTVCSRCIFCGFEGMMKKQYPFCDIYLNNYFLVICPDCKTHNLYPLPDSKLLAQAYSESYYGEKQQKFSFPFVENILDWFRDSRARKLSRLLSDGASVLDLGCGNGRFLFSLTKKKNIVAWGIEPPGKSASRASQIPGIKIKTGYLEYNDFHENQLDAVTLFHVFEHLPNPTEILDIIDHILKPGGYLFFSFPNIGSWQSLIWKGYWLHLDPPRHLFFIPPEIFIKTMAQRGYKILEQKYGSNEQNPFGMVQSALNTIISRRDLLFEYLKGNESYLSGYPRYKILLQKLFFFFSFPWFMFSNWIASIFRKGATVEFIFQKLN